MHRRAIQLWMWLYPCSLEISVLSLIRTWRLGLLRSNRKSRALSVADIGKTPRLWFGIEFGPENIQAVIILQAPKKGDPEVLKQMVEAEE